MKVIQSFRVPHQSTNPDLQLLVAQHLGIEKNKISEIRILKRSLDARQRRHMYWVYALEIYFQGESAQHLPPRFPQIKWNKPPPLIIGAGPAGLFAAWTFLQHGINPILFERGDRTHERMRKISKFWRHGILDTDSNVCYGEGGAGTFSDGKLITRIKSPLISHVMQTFVQYGAPAEITYVYNPHVGSNFIREIIRKMSDHLIAQGGDFRFKNRVVELDIYQNQAQGVILADGSKIEGTGLILACGHSASELFQNLHHQGVCVTPKSFALGLRIEHSQDYINKLQYGCIANDNLEPAQYKLTHYWDEEKVGVYTFCMCPGGYVISSTTDPKTIVINGMSNYQRNSRWANAAVVCSISTESVAGNDPFKMLKMQRSLEQSMFNVGYNAQKIHKIPAQHLDDFLSGKQGRLRSTSSCPSGVFATNLAELLPHKIYDYLSQGLLAFDKKRIGFSHPNALLHGIESRTSSPIRISRHPDTLESTSTAGLFPCGEGPGYAGGITSAAVDGIKAALAWIKKFAIDQYSPY